MSFKNLWNSLCGKSTPSTSKDGDARKSGTRSRRRRSEQSDTRKLAVPTKPKLGLKDLVGGGAQASICRLVKRSGATSVLEIGIGDGSRALAVAKSLVEANPDENVRYAAIDMFEMGDGPVTLKEFNQQLRAQNVKPSLVPLPLEAGLARVSSTLGIMDLVLIAEPAEDVDLQQLEAALKRLTTTSSSVFHLVDQKWTKIDLHGVSDSLSAKRAA